MEALRQPEGRNSDAVSSPSPTHHSQLGADSLSNKGTFSICDSPVTWEETTLKETQVSLLVNQLNPRKSLLWPQWPRSPPCLPITLSQAVPQRSLSVDVTHTALRKV